MLERTIGFANVNLAPVTVFSGEHVAWQVSWEGSRATCLGPFRLLCDEAYLRLVVEATVVGLCAEDWARVRGNSAGDDASSLCDVSGHTINIRTSHPYIQA